MLVLSLKTDSPEAQVALFENGQKIAEYSWQAHKILAETLHTKIANLLASKNLELQSIQGIVAFKGPGSFTGLRIGLSVTNALAYALQIPIVGTNQQGWQAKGCLMLASGENHQTALPEYDRPAFVTEPKK